MKDPKPRWIPEPGEDGLGTEPDPVPPRPPPPRQGAELALSSDSLGWLLLLWAVSKS